MTKLSVRSLAIACALLWAGALFVVGVLNRYFPNYGWGFLAIVDSIYPGYHVAYGLKNLIVGIGYALLDGAIVGAILAWLYNCFSCCGCHPNTDTQEQPPTKTE